MAEEKRKTRDNYDTYVFLELVQRTLTAQNHKELYEIVKEVNLNHLNIDETLSRLCEVNSTHIFNGLLGNPTLSAEKKLELIEKYNFVVFPENNEIIKRAELYCGKLGIEEVYEHACAGWLITKEALQNAKFTPVWVDKFLAIADKFLTGYLMECVEMTFEQFVVALEKTKSKEVPREGETAYNSNAIYQIKKLYPFTKEQEEILKPYCEYNVFMHSLDIDPTYEKIMFALSNTGYSQWGSCEIGQAIEKATLSETEQLEILKKAVEKLKKSNLKAIATGLLDNDNFSVEALILMCKIEDLESELIFSVYSDLDEKIINYTQMVSFTEKQKQDFKSSRIYAAFNGASEREDFTFDDYLEMINNHCDFTAVAINNIISRFIKLENRKTVASEFNNERELRLAQAGSRLITHCLLEADNPNSDPETLICFAKTPLSCASPHTSPSFYKDKILEERITNTNFSDEQFDRLLQTANDFEAPTNPHVIRLKSLETELDFDQFHETIPYEEREQYFNDLTLFQSQKNWAKTINTGLINKNGLSFDRLVRVLETAQKYETFVDESVLHKAVNSMAFTIPQLEKMIELGFDFLKSKLEEMKHNPDSEPAPLKTATIDFLTQTIILPDDEDQTFYVVDVIEGHYDKSGKPLPTKRIFLPIQCDTILFDNNVVSFFPTGEKKTTSYNYKECTSKLRFCDYYDEFWVEEAGIKGAVISINTSLIADNTEQISFDNDPTKPKK